MLGSHSWVPPNNKKKKEEMAGAMASYSVNVTFVKKIEHVKTYVNKRYWARGPRCFQNVRFAKKEV